MALEETVVYRQLDTTGRFKTFGAEDAVPVLCSYSLTYLVGHLGLGLSQGYCYVAMASTALAVYFLRRRFEDGLFGVVRFVTCPKHLSSLAADSIVRPYPAAERSRHAQAR